MDTITSNSPEETRQVAAKFAAALQPGTVIALHGDLGAGKTQFVKGIASAFGIQEQDVTSPTFTLINEYQGDKLPIYHFDLYRLETAQAVAAIGFEEYCDAGGVTVIEWPERAADLLPANTIHITIEMDEGNSRKIKFHGR